MMENEVGGLDEDEIACGQKRSPMIGVLLVELPSTVSQIGKFRRTEGRKSSALKVV